MFNPKDDAMNISKDSVDSGVYNDQPPLEVVFDEYVEARVTIDHEIFYHDQDNEQGNVFVYRGTERQEYDIVDLMNPDESRRNHVIPVDTSIPLDLISVKEFAELHRQFDEKNEVSNMKDHEIFKEEDFPLYYYDVNGMRNQIDNLHQLIEFANKIEADTQDETFLTQQISLYSVQDSELRSNRKELARAAMQTSHNIEYLEALYRIQQREHEEKGAQQIGGVDTLGISSEEELEVLRKIIDYFSETVHLYLTDKGLPPPVNVDRGAYERVFTELFNNFTKSNLTDNETDKDYKEFLKGFQTKNPGVLRKKLRSIYDVIEAGHRIMERTVKNQLDGFGPGIIDEEDKWFDSESKEGGPF